MVDFATNYLASARQMCNVNLVCKEGSIVKSHALLLASASKLMKALILEVIDNSDDVVVIILPDFNRDEVEQGLEQIIRGDSLNRLESTILSTLGVDIPIQESNIKDVKGEADTFSEPDLKDEQISDYCSETEYPVAVKDYVCSYCNIQFSTHKRMTCHMSIEHELKTDEVKFDHMEEESSMKGEEMYRCNYSNCAKRFVNDVAYSNHMSSSHEDKTDYEEMYRCNYCAKRFANEGAFSNHMSRSHEDKTDYYEHIEEVDGKWICKVCRKSYPKNPSLQQTPSRVSKLTCIQHWRKVHNKLNSKVKCDICNKELSNKWNLKLHMKMHAGKRDFICDTCGSGFLDKKQLEKHHVRLHGSEQEKELKKTHFCSTCGKGFWNKTSLTTHEDVHLEGNNFICDQCECTFKTSNALRIHTNRIHLGKWVLTEEQRAKQNLRKRKFRADKKAKNGGMLRTPEEKAVFNEYMRNYMARRKAAAKDTVVRQLNM